MTTIKKLSKKKIAAIAAGALVVILIIIHFASGNKSQYQTVAVKRGSITEIVSVTGNTTPLQSLDLSFQTAGVIAAVYKEVGAATAPGDVIAKLDTSDLETQLAQAQANVDQQSAALKKLQAGPTPQNIAVSQTALTAAEQTLANTYLGVPNTLAGAYADANDAIRNQLADFFSQSETNNPQLTFGVTDSQLANNIVLERIRVSEALDAWQTELQTLLATAPTSTLDTALQNAVAYLQKIKSLAIDSGTAVINAINLSATTASAYKTDATTALTDVNTALTNVTTAIQNIASEKASVAQSQAALNLTLAGSTQDDIDAQQAQVEQAQANLQNIQVKIAQASLVSPISGTITTQNAKVGQVAVIGTPVTSIISNNNLEVDADVPEVDIGKVQIGNPVDITLNAFPGETFTGKVFYINPGQTVINGVVDYLVKVSFDKLDPRMKAGLTADLDIKTQTDRNALILPQYAVIQNTSGTFVEVLSSSGTPQQIPVTLGIQDQSGNVEIASGVTEGEQVVNIGLKQ
ncbi:MAG: efflux RND transporter periplasmic adaptor subunit [Patescibacteria group bacterium]|nr:efflux RND transporter periplasmic adaptor subunit [Patescibacteria group bacterium]